MTKRTTPPRSRSRTAPWASVARTPTSGLHAWMRLQSDGVRREHAVLVLLYVASLLAVASWLRIWALPAS